MQGIDPKWVFYLGIIVTIETALGQGTVSLTNVAPEWLIPYIKGWSTLLAFIGTAVMTALSGYSSRTAGPLITPPSATTVKVLAWLIIPLGLAALLIQPAHAQAQKKIGGPVGHALDVIQGGQPQGSDQGGGVSSSNAGVTSLLDKPFQDLANFIGDDIEAAIALSTSVPSLQDGNGQQCLTALKTFGDVVKAHPAPLTFKIASDLEAFRLKQMAVNRLCSNTACTVVFADITATATAASPIPLAIPSLHDLCSKVPTIAVTAAVSTPAVSSPLPTVTSPPAPQ